LAHYPGLIDPPLEEHLADSEM
jgi:hypothetical protein